MMHLGPDGTATYTHSVAEIVDAIFSNAKHADPTIDGMLIAWDHQGTVIKVPGDGENVLDYDPFADTWGVPSNSARDASWAVGVTGVCSCLLPLDVVADLVERIAE